MTWNNRCTIMCTIMCAIWYYLILFGGKKWFQRLIGFRWIREPSNEPFKLWGRGHSSVQAPIILNHSGAFTGVAFTGVISCYSICISICFHLHHVSKIFEGTIGNPFASLECWAASRTGRTSNAAFAVVATSSMSPAKRPQPPRRPARRPPCQAKRFLNNQP